MITQDDADLCPRCGSDDVVMVVDVSITIPAKWESALTKRRLSSRLAQVNGASWDLAILICRNCRLVESRRQLLGEKGT